MRGVWDILYARQPIINYVAPPVCEVIFSGSGQPIIVLSQNPVGKVTGLVLGGSGGFRLSWNIFPGAICYNIYYINGANVAMILAQCVSDPFYDLPEGLDPGNIVVTPITPEGEGEPSDPIPYPSGGGGGCSEEPGDPAPEGPEAFSIPVDEMTLDPIPIEREDMVFIPTLIDPVETNIAYKEFEGDYPPGHYNFAYAGGFISRQNPFANDGVAGIYYGGDDNNVIGSASYLINGIFEINPPFGGPFGSGISYTGMDAAEIEAQMEAYFNTPGDEKEWKYDQRHENDGGKIYAAFLRDFVDYDPPYFSPTDFEFVITLVQVDGLIQQPRKIRIQAWNIIKSNFPANIRDLWDGTFQTRSVYTETSVVWIAPPSGGFPGATVFYTQAHPTAPNGCGWVIHIGSIYWTGYKKVGDQPTGIYNQSSVVAPGCVTLEEYE